MGENAERPCRVPLRHAIEQIGQRLSATHAHDRRYPRAAFILHESNSWLYSRSAFLHHVIGWALIVAALFPLGRVFRPRSATFNTGFALTFVVMAVLLYAHRDVAPIFGHLSDELRGAQP